MQEEEEGAEDEGGRREALKEGKCEGLGSERERGERCGVRGKVERVE